MCSQIYFGKGAESRVIITQVLGREWRCDKTEGEKNIYLVLSLFFSRKQNDSRLLTSIVYTRHKYSFLNTIIVLKHPATQNSYVQVNTTTEVCIVAYRNVIVVYSKLYYSIIQVNGPGVPIGDENGGKIYRKLPAKTPRRTGPGRGSRRRYKYSSFAAGTSHIIIIAGVHEINANFETTGRRW